MTWAIENKGYLHIGFAARRREDCQEFRGPPGEACAV